MTALLLALLIGGSSLITGLVAFADDSSAEQEHATHDTSGVSLTEEASDPAEGDASDAVTDEGAQDAAQEGKAPSESAAQAPTNASLLGGPPQLLAVTPSTYFSLSPDGTTILNFIQNEGDPITDVEIPDEIVAGTKITAIANGAFAGKGITSVSIPEAVTSIGNSAFANNPLMASVTFAGTSQLASIGDEAFKDCIGLSGITIPIGTTSLGSKAFNGCTSLTAIDIPAGITKINNSTFAGCSNLAAVTLHEGLLSIDSSAFNLCSPLTAITLPSTVTALGASAFENTALANITLSSSLQTIGAGCFSATKLTSITIPANVTTIGNNAFMQTIAGITINLPDHYPNSIAGKPWGAITENIYWKSVDSSCFYITPDGTLVGLKPAGHDGGICSTGYHEPGAELVIPASVGGITVTGLLPSAFQGNTNIVSVKFDPGCTFTTIAPGAFNNCFNLKTVQLNEGLTSIGSFAFAACYKLDSVNFPSTLTKIEDIAFAGDGALKDIQLNSGLETIGTRAFFQAKPSTLSIPSSVKSIGWEAFAGNDDLTTVTVEGSNPNLAIGTNAFPDAEKMKDIYLLGFNEGAVAGQPWGGQYATVHWQNGEYPPEVIITPDGWHYNRINGNIIKYAGPSGAGVDVVVPYEITSEGNTYYVTKPLPAGVLQTKTFKTITVSDGYTSIPQAFAQNTMAEKVTLPEGLTTIGAGAFGPSSVKSVNIPSSVQTIGAGAFGNATGATIEGVLPASLTTVGDNAFKNVPLNIENLQIPGTVKTIGAGAFDNCGLKGTIVIPNSVTSLTLTSFNNNPGIKNFVVNQYRSTCPFAASGSFMTDRQCPVLYLGEIPQAAAEVVADSSLDNTPLVRVDVSAQLQLDPLGQPVAYLAGMWVSDSGTFDDPSAHQKQIYDYTVSGNKTEAVESCALPAGTYYFFVSSSKMTKDGGKPDPSQYIRFEIVVSSPLALDVEGTDVVLLKKDAGTFTAQDVLTKAQASAVDPVTQADLTCSISPEDMDKVNALTDDGDSTQVNIRAACSGDYEYTGSYHTLVNPANYELTGTKEITVTLINGYTVSFAQGSHGTLPEEPSGTKTYTDLYPNEPMPAAPSVAPDSGYSFAGWKDLATGTVYQPQDLPAQVTSNIAFEAQYTVNQYTLSFDLNGAPGSPPTSQTVSFGGHSQGVDAPTWAGHTFLGWNTAPDGSGALWDPASFTMPAANVALYAQWSVSPVPPVPPTPPTPPTPPVTPVTPDTPPVEAPISTVTPSSGFVATDTATIDDSVTVNENAVPLYGEGAYWALANLILVILGFVCAGIALIRIIFNARKDNDDEKKKDAKAVWFVASLVVAVIAVIAFFLTENMNNSMAIFDRWTIMMAIIFAATLVASLFVLRKQDDDTSPADSQPSKPLSRPYSA